MPKSLNDEQLDEVLASDEDDFGSGIEDTPPSKTPPSEDLLEDEELETEVEPEEEIESVSPRSLAEKYGFKLDGEDEVEALDKHFGQVSQYVLQARQREQQYQDQLRQYQYQLQQIRQEPPQPKPADTPKPLSGLLKHWEKVPEWDDNWRTMVKQDENGEWVAKPGADPSLPQKIQARIAWEERAQRSFFENPQQFVYETFQANTDFQSAINQQIQQAVLQVQDNIEAQRLADQMRPYLFNEDGTQNEAGKAYMNAVRYAETNLGIFDAQRLHQVALQAAGPYLNQPKEPPETPSEKKKKRQLEFAKGQAARTPNKGRKKTPARRLTDAEGMNRYAHEQMRDKGIDPHALAEVR